VRTVVGAVNEAYDRVVVEPPTAPGSLEPAGSDDVLGRRIAAGLIDVALLIVLFVVLGVTIGDTKTEGGNNTVALNGWPFLLYLALVLLYYFVLEAIWRASLGKLLLGLRVVGRDGGRPSAGAIALRTLLRIVDWLPFFYLVGFIALLATGTRRQRLGDLAAKTRVVRAS
jgi:uncharacterized RDD family membrane protein YckC